MASQRPEESELPKKQMPKSEKIGLQPLNNMRTMATVQGDDGDGEEDEGAIFLNTDDVEQEILLDDEDLPDIDHIEDNVDPNEEPSTSEPDDSIHLFTGHTDSVYAVACSPADPNLVATGGGDDKAYLWRIGDSSSPLELKGHMDSVGTINFSRDGALLASGGLDGIVHIWETSSGALKQKFEGPSEAIEWVKWHPRGHVLLAGSEDFTTWMWNADTSLCMAVFTGHNGSVTCGEFTPNGKLVCTGSVDGSLRVWDPKSGECILVVQGHPYHTEGLTCLGINPDSSIVVSGSTDNSVCVVNIRTGKVVGTLVGHSKSVECAQLASGFPLAATGAMDGKLIIWDLQSLAPRSTCQHEDGVIKVIWSSSSNCIFTGCLDGKIRVWDSRTGICQRTFHGHEDSILDLAVSQNDRFIISGSDDKTARVFDLM